MFVHATHRSGPTRRRRSGVLTLAAVALVTSLVLGACETTTSNHEYSLALTNAARSEAGVAPLEANGHLVVKADSWAAILGNDWVRAGCPSAPTGFLRHSNLVAQYEPQFVSESWRSAAENVGVSPVVNGDVAGSITALQQRYLASPGHRANLLNPAYRWAGHAVVLRPSPSQLAEGWCPGTAPESMLFSAVAFVG